MMEEGPSMSDPKAPPTRRRYRFWAIALPVTLVLMYPAYRAWTRVSEAKRELAKVLAREESIRQEHVRWSGLATEQSKLRSEAGKRRQDIVSALRSFSRDELHDALRRAVESADPAHAIVLEMPGLLWGIRVWMWVPEPDHRLIVQIATTGLMEEDLVDGVLDVEQDLKLDLSPEQLHRIEFSIEERHKSRDCVVRLRFNDQMIVEETMLLDPNSSTSYGRSSDGVLVRPRVVSSDWTWNESPSRLFQRGIWHTLGGREFGLRAARRDEDGDGRTVKISLKMGIASSRPLYAPKSTEYVLTNKHGFQVAEVDDIDSEFHGLLQITGPAAPNPTR